MKLEDLVPVFIHDPEFFFAFTAVESISIEVYNQRNCLLNLSSGLSLLSLQLLAKLLDILISFPDLRQSFLQLRGTGNYFVNLTGGLRDPMLSLLHFLKNFLVTL